MHLSFIVMLFEYFELGVGCMPMNVKALFPCGTGILPVPEQTGEMPVPQEVYLQNWDAP